MPAQALARHAGASSGARTVRHEPHGLDPPSIVPPASSPTSMHRHRCPRAVEPQPECGGDADQFEAAELISERQ
eukprot:9393863-Pyramimonas_sp.AAC.1